MQQRVNPPSVMNDGEPKRKNDNDRAGKHPWQRLPKGNADRRRPGHATVSELGCEQEGQKHPGQDKSDEIEYELEDRLHREWM